MFLYWKKGILLPSITDYPPKSPCSNTFLLCTLKDMVWRGNYCLWQLPPPTPLKPKPQATAHVRSCKQEPFRVHLPNCYCSQEVDSSKRSHSTITTQAENKPHFSAFPRPPRMCKAANRNPFLGSSPAQLLLLVGT